MQYVCQGMWDLRLHGIDRYFRFVAVMQYNPWFLCDGSNIAPFKSIFRNQEVALSPGVHCGCESLKTGFD